MAKRKRKTQFVYRDNKRYRISFYTTFTVLLIFLGGLLTAVSYAYIHDIQRQITATRGALQEKRESNSALLSDITQRYTSDEISRLAAERLGMGKPDASQIIHIQVPKQSYVVLNEDTGDSEPESGYLWREIGAFLKGLVS